MKEERITALYNSLETKGIESVFSRISPSLSESVISMISFCVSFNRLWIDEIIPVELEFWIISTGLDSGCFFSGIVLFKISEEKEYKEEKEEYIKIANKFKLIYTSGSDFHGRDREQIKIGRGFNGNTTASQYETYKIMQGMNNAKRKILENNQIMQQKEMEYAR